jgi:hypothetical protein
MKEMRQLLQSDVADLGIEGTSTNEERISSFMNWKCHFD